MMEIQERRSLCERAVRLRMGEPRTMIEWGTALLRLPQAIRP